MPRSPEASSHRPDNQPLNPGQPLLRVQLRSKAERAHFLAHLMAGVTLLGKGIEHLPAFHHHPVAVTFTFTAAALLLAGTFFHHWLAQRFHHFNTWFNILGGLILIGEAIESWAAGADAIHYFLFITGLLWIGMGIFDKPLKARAHLLLTGTGLRIRTSWMRKYFLSWTELADVQVLPDGKLRLKLKNGKVKREHIYHHVPEPVRAQLQELSRQQLAEVRGMARSKAQ